LEVCRRAGDFTRGDHALKRTMAGLRMSPSLECWNSLLGTDPTQAFKVWDQMKSAGIKPDHRSLTLLLGALRMTTPNQANDESSLGKEDIVKRGWTLLKTTFPKDHGVTPNEHNWAALLDLCEEHGDFEQIRQARDEMATLFPPHSPEATCSPRASALTFRNGWQDPVGIIAETEEMIKLLRSNGYVPQLSALPALVSKEGKMSSEEKERSLIFHAEKKALAVLLHCGDTQPFVSVSTRMCQDCHQAFSIAAKATNRVIRCEDTFGLHVFDTAGNCSCSGNPFYSRR